MILKAKLFLLLLICILVANANTAPKGCEIGFVVQNSKIEYTSNDTITVLVKVKLDEAFCDEAGGVTKIFCKGLKIEKRSEWKKMTENTLGQKLVLTVLRRTNMGTLTAYRKTGHYDCFRQIKFNIRED